MRFEEITPRIKRACVKRPALHEQSQPDRVVRGSNSPNTQYRPPCGRVVRCAGGRGRQSMAFVEGHGRKPWNQNKRRDFQRRQRGNSLQDRRRCCLRQFFEFQTTRRITRRLTFGVTTGTTTGRSHVGRGGTGIFPGDKNPILQQTETQRRNSRRDGQSKPETHKPQRCQHPTHVRMLSC